MKQVLAFNLGEGEDPILVEVEAPAPQGGWEEAGWRPREVGERVFEAAELVFEKAVARIPRAAEVLLAQMQEISQRPHEIAVKFGCKLDAHGRAAIVAGGAEAHFKITLRWQQPQKTS